MDALLLAPGWYTDTADAGFLRFWTGTAWSAHRKPRPGLPAAFQQQRSRAAFRRSGRIA